MIERVVSFALKLSQAKQSQKDQLLVTTVIEHVVDTVTSSHDLEFDTKPDYSVDAPGRRFETGHVEREGDASVFRERRRELGDLTGSPDARRQ